MAIRGRVSSDREGLIELSVGSPSGPKVQITAILDTGFTDFLTLPSALVSRLALEFREFAQAELADGTIVQLPAYEAVVTWHAEERRIVVCGADGAPLLGMSLLYGSRLTMEAVDGGEVIIERLES